MTDASYKRKGQALVALCVAGLIALAGCGPKNYKQDADERVYTIIDEKWDPAFGSKANYRISDTAPSPNDIPAATAVPVSGVLTFPQAMALATAQNREYQTEKETLYSTALDLRLVRHSFENQLFGGGSLFYSNNGRDESVAAEANVGFNRLLATGTQISSAIAARWLAVLIGAGDHGLASVFTATVAQPLLRGSDRTVVLENLTQAERNTLYQIRTFNRFRKSFAVAVATQYFQVLELYDVVAITRDYLEALTELHDDVAKLAAAGRLPRLEADRLAQEVLRARDALILAQREYERFLDQFKMTLAVAPTTEFRLDTSVLAALKEHGIPEPEIAIDAAIESALLRRLDMANRADAVLDAQRAAYVAADALRAGLDVTGTAAVDSHGNGTVSAGPVLDVPLDRVEEQTVYRKALIALDQRRRDYDQATDTVRLEVREAYRKLQETGERYRVLSESLATARTRIARTSELLTYARVDSRRVLGAHADLYDARNAATDALIDYAIATLNFYRDTGVLQVRPDGMWEAGAGDAPMARTEFMPDSSVTRR
ncbi:MAG: TolC family protein [Sedimentisphaerales bacterium]|nr:TolC family protein [Sedimentisphaerales bacterium]